MTIPSLKLSLIAGLMALGPLAIKAAHADTAIVAGGCFWCVEANFESLAGVSEVISGFTGGKTQNPTYAEVSAENTGHYEAVEIHFDPAKVSYETLIGLFLRSSDVVDAGGQFCDRGSSYRTAIFATKAQKSAAEAAVAQAEADLGQKIVTPILPAATFTPADAYHQDYYKQTEVILTRFGPRQKAIAYDKYRAGCGRDARVKELWGSAATFLH